MRLATTLASLALAAALLFGCGGSDGSTTSITTTPDRAGKPPASANPPSTSRIRTSWETSPACKRPQGASRWGCSVDSYRCQAVVTDRGWSVDCAKPGRSIAFTVPPRK
jgi:hypothetical protein